jgi:hypothetical protein
MFTVLNCPVGNSGLIYNGLLTTPSLFSSGLHTGTIFALETRIDIFSIARIPTALNLVQHL